MKVLTRSGGVLPEQFSMRKRSPSATAAVNDGTFSLANASFIAGHHQPFS